MNFFRLKKLSIVAAVIGCLFKPDVSNAQSAKDSLFHFKATSNPIIRHKFTADPAAFVEGDTLWLFTGHDFAGGQTGYKMKDWCVFSTTDMKNWTEYPTPLKITDFSWDKTGKAYASQAIKRNGKYYWYVSTDGSGIGVAVADRPQGPYKDAIGKPILTNVDCFASKHYWTCIDPSVMIDDDGQAWLFWGNGVCYYAKLKSNMIEIDGKINKVDFPGLKFEEAPWIHKYKGNYYLSYASGLPEKTAYAMAKSIEGPYQYKGILNEVAGNCGANHHAIVEFKGKWYFIYHNGVIERDGNSFSRSVCIDRVYYKTDRSMKKVAMTSDGIF